MYLTKLIVLLCVVSVFSCIDSAGQTRTYNRTQISTGAFNHESPSINNRGDVVWSQQVGGFWQVQILRAGTTIPSALPGQAVDHNNTNPTIDDAGDAMYLKDGVGQGVARAVVLNGGQPFEFHKIN
ncbi:MAG: hypothetical protein LAO78_09365 [Acidobacteriia bacterium]|nr:hypothetical protein [Terriglobia bacterium]